ncbi:MAG: glutamate formimidoyltransferase [Smithellaceae bacterium]|nr:glutamate formimidoyltransferase [Smithellaceae bacterium]
MKIIECVPNFSEGRDRAKVEAIASAATNVPGVKVLNLCLDCDHNRSVLTFIGTPEDALTGALAVCGKAIELIDMSSHGGVHPRLGAVDVVPFIPLSDATVVDAVTVARRFGYLFSGRHQLPIYFYGEASLYPGRRDLSDIRAGGYEALAKKLQEPGWAPDAGPKIFNEKSGGTVVGVRMPLVAYNINLASSDLATAKDIACTIRERNGGLKKVKAMGVMLASRDIVQVSMNLTDYRVTNMKAVFDRVRELATAKGVEIIESELIGLAPEAAMGGVDAPYLKLVDFSPERLLEFHIEQMCESGKVY